MIRWTGFVIAHRKRIVAAWLVLFVLGGLAAANLGGLLSNRFSVPGSESERGLNLIRDRMGDRSDGSFTLVATGVDTPAERATVVAAAVGERRARQGDREEQAGGEQDAGETCGHGSSGESVGGARRAGGGPSVQGTAPGVQGCGRVRTQSHRLPV